MQSPEATECNEQTMQRHFHIEYHTVSQRIL
jgi:hypothetical protein